MAEGTTAAAADIPVEVAVVDTEADMVVVVDLEAALVTEVRNSKSIKK